jgi:DNA-binding response OmpR family regulator
MRARILVVDDERAIVFGMKSYFTRHGFIVDGATGVDEAEDLIATQEYALAFLDVRLSTNGAQEGLTLAETLRGNSTTLPIILMSAHDTPEVRRRASEMGADFVVKPQPLHKLARIARGLLTPHEERGEAATGS